MKHIEQWIRLVLVVLGTLSLVSSQDLKTSEDVGESGIPSGLRGVGGGVVVPEKMNHVVASLSSQIAEASGTAITKLTMEERANVMENLHKSIGDVSDFLANLTFVNPIDVHDSGVEHGQFVFQQLNHALESGKDARQDAIDFVRGSTPVVPRDGSDPKKDKRKSWQNRRRTKESDSSRESSHHSNNPSPRVPSNMPKMPSKTLMGPFQVSEVFYTILKDTEQVPPKSSFTESMFLVGATEVVVEDCLLRSMMRCACSWLSVSIL